MGLKIKEDEYKVGEQETDGELKITTKLAQMKFEKVSEFTYLGVLFLKCDEDKKNRGLSNKSQQMCWRTGLSIKIRTSIYKHKNKSV